MDMCRYSDKTFDGYRKITGELQRLCDLIHTTNLKEKQMAEIDGIAECESKNITCTYH